MASTPPHSAPTRLGISVKPVWLVWILVILAGLALLQDIISAWVHGTAFYWSEALLFKVYWFLFLPLGYTFFLFDGRHPGSSAWIRTGLRVLAASLILGGAHVLLFASVLYGVSELFFAESFSFYWAVEKNFSVHFYKYLAAYFGITAAVVAYHHYMKESWGQRCRP